MDVPSELRESIAAGWAGDAGIEWLDRLPTRIARAERRWRITVGEPYQPGGYTSFVAPAVTSAGDRAVYKATIPHPEALGEADALAAYVGDGAVRVLASEPDRFESLVERCTPGDSLWSVDSDDERLDIAGALMARLWRPPVSDVIADLGSV
ncbi:MAG: aminoglycoside phosphotransferase family protein, partial [Acidimicrobiia bacterium]